MTVNQPVNQNVHIILKASFSLKHYITITEKFKPLKTILYNLQYIPSNLKE